MSSASLTTYAMLRVVLLWRYEAAYGSFHCLHSVTRSAQAAFSSLAFPFLYLRVHNECVVRSYILGKDIILRDIVLVLPSSGLGHRARIAFESNRMIFKYPLSCFYIVTKLYTTFARFSQSLKSFWKNNKRLGQR